MQPTAVSLREVGQAQFTGSVQLSGRAELGAVVAPANHVLLMGAGSYRPKTTDNDSLHFGTRQWEAGAGTYWPLGQSQAWVVSGLVGFGRATTERRWGELLGSSLAYRASYRKVFGQVGVDFNDGLFFSMGLVYRFTRLNFEDLSYAGRYAQGRATNLRNDRHEVLLYVRRALPWGLLAESWQLQTTLGVSFGSANLVDPDTTPDAYAINVNRAAVPLCSVGLVYTLTPKRKPRL